MIPRNVAKLVGKPKHTPGVRGNLTADAAKHMLKAAIDVGDPMASRWAAAFMTGARQGELLGLMWDRVDLDAGVIDIARQLHHLPQVHGCGDQDGGKWPCGRDRPRWCPERKWDVPKWLEFVPCYRSLCWTRPKSAASKRPVPLVAALAAMMRVYRETGPQ